MGEFLHFVDQDTMPSEQRRGGGKEKTASSVLSASIVDHRDRDAIKRGGMTPR